MWTRELLKKNGRVAFLRNYWTCVLVSVLASLFITGTTGLSLNYNMNVQQTETIYSDSESIYRMFEQIPSGIIMLVMMVVIVACILSICFTILVSNVAEVGRNRYFIENREHKTNVSQLFYAFQGGRYGSTVWIMFLKNFYVWAWSLLFVIPGIIKSYSYMMVPYIVAENTYMDRKRVFELSRKMMSGHKWEAFVLSLSFIGWYLLGAITGGLVNVFYTNPYSHATFAEFYSALKAEAIQKGILRQGELPGVEIPEVEIPIV